MGTIVFYESKGGQGLAVSSVYVGEMKNEMTYSIPTPAAESPSSSLGSFFFQNLRWPSTEAVRRKLVLEGPWIKVSLLTWIPQVLRIAALCDHCMRYYVSMHE